MRSILACSSKLIRKTNAVNTDQYSENKKILISVPIWLYSASIWDSLSFTVSTWSTVKSPTLPTPLPPDARNFNCYAHHLIANMLNVAWASITKPLLERWSVQNGNLYRYFILLFAACYLQNHYAYLWSHFRLCLGSLENSIFHRIIKSNHWINSTFFYFKKN